METTISLLGRFWDSPSHVNIQLYTVTAALLSAFIWWFTFWRRNKHEPPALRDVLPFLTNTYQYMTNQVRFNERVRCASSVPSYKTIDVIDTYVLT